MNIKIKNGLGEVLDYKSFVFPAGEVGIKLDANNHKFFYESNRYILVARFQNSNDVFALGMIKDAIERIKSGAVIDLFMPYCQYSRQDRCCDKGEAFSLKVFANYINSLNFNKVTTLDPHSDVLGAVFDRLHIISQFDIINKFNAFSNRIMKGAKFVSPDAGGNKKTAVLAKYFGHSDFIRADKLRDLSNGNIKETIVYADDLTGQDIVIADDICEKGGTFIALAKALKAKNAGKIILFVSHGIFSHERGVDILFDNGIDEVYTTNSYKTEFDSGVVALDIEEEFKL